MHEECHLGQPFWALSHTVLIYHPAIVKKWLSFSLVKSKWSDSPWFMLWKLKSVLMICYSCKMLYTSQHFAIHCWSIAVGLAVAPWLAVFPLRVFQVFQSSSIVLSLAVLTQEHVLCWRPLIKTYIFIVLLTLSSRAFLTHFHFQFSVRYSIEVTKEISSKTNVNIQSGDLKWTVIYCKSVVVSEAHLWGDKIRISLMIQHKGKWSKSTHF